jgi:hypothetical protein
VAPPAKTTLFAGALNEGREVICENAAGGWHRQQKPRFLLARETKAVR